MSDGASGAPEFDPLVVESTDLVVPSRRIRNRWAIAGGGVAVAALVVLTLSLAGPASDGTPSEASPTPSSTAPPVSLAPVVSTYPFDWSVIDATGHVPTFSSDSMADDWIEWSLPAPAVVAGLDSSTEVVVLTADGVLHRIEFPSGTVRSRPIPDVSTDGQIALGADVVAVPQYSSVALVADDGALATTLARTPEVPRIVRLGALDRFLVTSGRAEPGGPEQQWLLDPNAVTTEPVEGPFAEVDPWDRQFTASGELLVRADGGVDAVGIDGSQRRQIALGDVLGTGPNHYVVRRCDQECDYTVVDAFTGDEAAAALGVLDAYRFYDTAVRISPDGRYAQVVDWRREQPDVVVVSVADGEVVNSWATRSIRTPDAWAPDSSGVFGTANESLAYYGVDGAVTVIDGLGPVRSVATRPLG